jgi:hypothetical protein
MQLILILIFNSECLFLNSQSEIYTSGYAAATYLNGRKFNKKAYIIGEAGLGKIVFLFSFMRLNLLVRKRIRYEWPSLERNPGHSISTFYNIY